MKKIDSLALALFLCLLGANVSVAQTATTDPGVVINGVTWATRNVDTPHTFVEKPEDNGLFYRWGRLEGWSATDPVISTTGETEWPSNSWSASMRWQENDPSPVGWRLPSYKEIEEILLNADKVTYEWTVQNGVNGGRFTDKASGNSIFLPASGYRNSNGILTNIGTSGCYWTSTPAGGNHADYLDFEGDAIRRTLSSRIPGYSVRSVKADASTAIPTVAAETDAITLFLNSSNGLVISGIRGKATATLFNINGQMALSSNINSGEALSVAHLPTGIYFVRIQTDAKISTHKFILKK
jgi:uncharacterized protein (TIGR02145 family)